MQLKNLKRSRSSEGGSYDRSRRQITFNNSNTNGLPESNNQTESTNNSNQNHTEKPINHKTVSTSSSNDEDEDLDKMNRKVRSVSADNSGTLTRQVEIANDEVKLLKNKISRLEDDLLIVTQVIK